MGRLAGIDVRTSVRIDKIEIERASRQLIERIWSNQKLLFPMGSPERILMLDPRVACAELGITYDPHPSLPWYTPRGIVEVAGMLDREAKTVSVAQKYGPLVERFTAAHELGHLLMHPGEVMHRDVPDGLCSEGKSHIEQEADYFAACFLIPINLLREEFEKRFGAEETFTFDDHSSFWLTPDDPERLLAQGKLQQRAIAIANASRFNGKAFPSLCQRFSVSRVAMKIRLIETGIVRGFP